MNPIPSSKSFDMEKPTLYEKKWLWAFSLLAAAALGLQLTVSSCNPTPPDNSRAAQAERGKALFDEYCASCHGPEAQGMVMDSLQKDPADLTTIVARRGGGEFPILEIARVIDGRKMVKGHGDRDMPVWGDVFAQEGQLTEEDIKGKLAEIIAYLLTIQK